MTDKELQKIFRELKNDDRDNLINSFIRWWTYGEREMTIDDVSFSNRSLNFDVMSFGIAVVRNIGVVDSTNHRIEVKILPYELFIEIYIINNSTFLRNYHKYFDLDELLSQLKRFGKEITYPPYFKSKEELLEG